jgi:hypothetical protein
MIQWLQEHLPESMAGLIVGLVGWYARRAIHKVDEQEDRIALLEAQQVKREDIDALRETFDLTLTRSLSRIEKRQDELMLELVARSRDRR